jgi:hypothetical protein
VERERLDDNWTGKLDLKTSYYLDIFIRQDLSKYALLMRFSEISRIRLGFVQGCRSKASITSLQQKQLNRSQFITAISLSSRSSTIV